MGNKSITTNSFSNSNTNIYLKVANEFEEFKTDLMSIFKENNRGSQQKIDTIAFYGDFREILIIDGNDKKKEIELLVHNFKNTYVLTDNQITLIDKIMLKI